MLQYDKLVLYSSMEKIHDAICYLGIKQVSMLQYDKLILYSSMEKIHDAICY